MGGPAPAGPEPKALATAARPDHTMLDHRRPVAGFTTLVAVGGDGTLGEVLEACSPAECPAGRWGADDLARRLGL